AISLMAAHEPLEYATASKSVYSDLGFIVLGWLLERAAGLRLDVQAARGIFQPLGLGSTTFVNLADSEARAPAVQPIGRGHAALPGAAARDPGRGRRPERLCHGRHRRPCRPVQRRD